VFSFRAASFASLSASSLPWIPSWALTHEKSIFQLAVGYAQSDVGGVLLSWLVSMCSDPLSLFFSKFVILPDDAVRRVHRHALSK